MSNMSRIITHKTENYTTISNHILKDKTVSLKAKAIFITIMSLPPTWNININGLCSIVKEGKSAIQSALNELIKLGYCQRTQIKNKNHFAGYLYELYEIPYDNEANYENQDTKNTYPENQDTEIQDTENQSLLNTDVLNTLSIKEKGIKPPSKFGNFVSYAKYLESIENKDSNEYKLLIFIKENLPKVSKMKTQMTIENVNFLFEKYKGAEGKLKIKHTLEQMENWKPLLNKNESVFLTLKNWLNK